MNVKKYFLGLAFLAVSQFSHPYIITIHNQTDGGLEAVIERAGSGVCSSLTALVKANGSKKVDCGNCCPKKISVEKFSGSNPGAVNVSRPPSTGAGISCRSSSITVIDAGRKIVSSYAN